MEETIVGFFSTNIILAVFLSIILNIIVAITGVLPSTFITIATVTVFGFTKALLLLIIGEAAGAVVSFYLYRKGIQKLVAKQNKPVKSKLLLKLSKTDNRTAFFMVIILRVIPFIPSGAVTLTAAISKISLLAFSIASTIGKIPALVMETYSVSQFISIKTEWQIGILLTALFIFLLYLFFKKKKDAA